MDDAQHSNDYQEIMTPKEVSEYLKLPLSTVYKLSQEGKLQAVKFGKHWRYLRSDIESYMLGLNALGSFAEGTERRRFPRKICTVSTVFEIVVPNLKECRGHGTIRNISVGGALLEIGSIMIDGQFLMSGDPIDLTFDPTLNEGLTFDEKLHGVIARFKQGEHTCLWIQFREVSLKAADKLVTRLAG